jgi:hypothetical protein
VLGQRGDLPQAEPRVRRGVVVDAAEELRRRHAVVDEHAPSLDLDQLVEDLAADREVQDERVLRLDGPEEAPVRQRVDAGLDLERVRVGLVAPASQPAAQREDVIAHRVAVRENGVELVHRGRHDDGARPITA